MIGQKCEFRSDSDERNVDASRGTLPPRSVRRRGACRSQVQFAARDGVARPWVVHFVPLTAESSASAGAEGVELVTFPASWG